MIEPDAPRLAGRPVLSQRWSDAVFLHWRVAPQRIAHMLPPGVRPDTFDGSAWVGLVPFVLSEFRFLPLPPVPLLGTFAEINVRTYGVDADGRRGVVFRTLEAEHLVPVLTARGIFGLPYRWAQIGMRMDRPAGTIEYRSRRRRPDGRPSGPGTRIAVHVGTDPVDTPLSRFLTARWGFHERHLGRTRWAANEHPAWPLVDARVTHLRDGLLADQGFADLAQRPPDSVLAMPLGHPGFITHFGAPTTLG
ncbi:DUF2071 domain-containing protein [Planococcus sp. APC 4015]|nr:DUF2071 domain-containing protein [Planococcus sp. APC 4015]